MNSDLDSAIGREAGVSGAKERRWGLIGGVVGSALGVGSALIGVWIDGVKWHEGGPYPAVFERTELLALDVYFLLVLIVGAAFSSWAIVSARRSPFPRTQAFGAGLMGLILSTLAGTILFVRVVALVGAF